MRIDIIGIDDNQIQYFNPQIKELMAGASHFSGGTRHYSIVKHHLPANHLWMDVTVPLSGVINEYRQFDHIVVFASGDPLFFGLANTLIREIPQAEITVHPSFNSLQLLAHRMLMPYHDMHVVSLTGRPWDKLDEALIEGHAKIGILTDNKEHTPKTIAQRMIHYGYDNYTVSVGELLGNVEKERVTHWELQEVVHQEFLYPNNLILRQTQPRQRPFGIEESQFALLDGRVNMITKMPIRLLSLSMLQLRDKKVMWDIGFCTGSVSIEAKLQFPHLKIVAFEKRQEGETLMEQNSIKFGAPGIQSVIGDFMTCDLSLFPTPDAVFIGGHGGRIDEMIEKLSNILASGSLLVFNSVHQQSKSQLLDAIQKWGFRHLQSIQIKVDEHNAIDVIQIKKS